ncbi:integrase [Arthrobacter sp. ERGS1:01]|nr:integrase [Arthrobacter sp. ERGS1:01]ALE04445.1 integrase [Arthrobacter sp. ERGS1:01]ALE05608.1 integrase [Arthrobacter sp. ERGS1:01]ALE06367.1 integrase [Arthrobacter sp. ERGS1:01]ALE06391.1 integrase [Arthrobacter sp. ERGS1:01]
MKVSAVIALRASHPLPLLLAAAGLPRSTFFHRQAALTAPDRHAELRARIHEVFTEAKGRYGHRRIHAFLRRQGWQVAKKTVLKLMRAENLVCKVRSSRRRYSSYKGQVGKIAENLLKRQFVTAAPNLTWVTDVTEFKVADRKVYLSPVMDLFDRSVVSFAVSESPNTAFTNRSLSEAISTLGPGEAPMVHSDQGFQYQHASWQKLLSNAGMTQSMSRKGNCLDNSVMENFFGHLKEEMFHHQEHTSPESFITELEDYIRWYNKDRISLTLECLSPMEYRAQALAT